ncbi:GvpL/GvpF family gas vesicle protein [Halomicroarcula limicola]|uniref:GvpL/GvpF family gas vesicle protein n=1 Tax=Haloarcula limicola TaxID=1429915 RepID=A0A8J8C4U8_9EURY|nr:GvpL/GvpF family gas vesicle protein [Halomicroarcula limicola]MBV0926051.1 GvpL/GvpF family gas vesicle protein [Halomicroarcula limicola]
MTDDGATDQTTTDEGAAADETAGDEGRYLYCVVDVADADDVETGTTLDAEGVDGEEPYLAVQNGLAALVQRRATPYDSDDETTVKRWLLQHQGVVDAAHERFGTPLPVRFDTILQGDDDGIAAWLDRQREDLQPALDRFAGRSEYRIELTCDADAFGAGVTEGDDRLDELQDESDEADSGTAFLKSKQVDQRERSLVAEEWNETAASLRESLDDHAAEIRNIDRNVTSLDEDDRDDADFETAFSVLADEEAAGAIGDQLDEIAARPGVEVRYTGPWPPYTFAPTLGNE